MVLVGPFRDPFFYPEFLAFNLIPSSQKFVPRGDYIVCVGLSDDSDPAR